MATERPTDRHAMRLRLELVLLSMALCICVYAYVGQRPSRPSWGVFVDAHGMIAWVDPSSPAELAGLRAGDRLQPPVDLRAPILTSLDSHGRPLRHTFPAAPAPTAGGIIALLICLCALGVCGAGWVSSTVRRDGALIAATGLTFACMLLSFVGAQAGRTWFFQFGPPVRELVLVLWMLALYWSIPFDWFQYRLVRRGYAAAVAASAGLGLLYAQERACGLPSLLLRNLVQTQLLLLVAGVVLAQTLRTSRLTAARRTQGRLLLTSFVLGVVPYVGFVTLPRLTGMAVGPQLPLVAFAFLVVALGITVAMVRGGLLTLGVTARRGITRFTLAILVAIGFVLVVEALGPSPTPAQALVALYATVAFLIAVALLPWADRLVEEVLVPELGLSRALLLDLLEDLKYRKRDLIALARTIERAAEEVFPGVRASLLVLETGKEVVFGLPSRGRMVALPALRAALTDAAGLARTEVHGVAAEEWVTLETLLNGQVPRLLGLQVNGELIAFLAVVQREAEQPLAGCGVVEALELLAAGTALSVNHAWLHRERALEEAVSSRLADALTGLTATMRDMEALPDVVARALARLPGVVASAVALREADGQARACVQGELPAELLERLADTQAVVDGAHDADAGPSLVVPLRGEGAQLGALYLAWAPGRPMREYEERLLRVFGHAVGLTLENARLFAHAMEQARREAEEAAALAHVSAALASTLDPESIYEVILVQAAQVLPFDRAEIVLYRDGWAVSAACLGEPSVPPGTRLAQVDTNTSTWQALIQGKVAYLADTADVHGWQDSPPWVGPFRIRSSVRVPLMVEGDLLGTFGVSSVTPGFYKAEQLRAAAAFGERAAQALRNARLYEAEQGRRRAAEELARMRKDFVASVSHELRTPLTAIVGYSELLKARWGQMSDAARLERLERIVLSAHRQQRLVEDLLLVTRLEQQALHLHAELVDMASMVREAVDEVRGAYRGQHVTMRGPEAATALADAGRTVQILVNLVDNAAKYSAEGDPIAVEWALEGAMAAVRVRDHGPGIPEGARGQLFTRFGRVPGSRMRAGHVGTGLGLYLSRTLAEAMGGGLDLEETSPEGSTFRLRLPRPPT